MKRKIMYVFALVCCMHFFSSAKQICTGSVKEYNQKKTVCVKKAPVKIKKITKANTRPFHFYLFTI